MRLLTRIRTLARARQAPEPALPEVAQSVAIILDGNGRWAKRRRLPTAAGHRAGARTVRRIVEASIEIGIHDLAVFAFSTENWSRSEEEVDALMEIFAETIERELPDLAEQGVRVRFIGRRDRAPESLRARMDAMEDRTALNTRINLWVAFDYGGRAELVGRGGGHRRERFRREPLRSGASRSGSPDPDERRAAYLELPPLAGGVLRAGLRRQVLARLRRERSPRRTARVRLAPAPFRRTRVTNWVSRLIVAIIGVPIVLGAVYLGGWWMFALAVIAAAVALHEYWLLARPLAPLAPAGYIGAVLALVGAEVGGIDWAFGGLLTTFVVAFVLKAISDARAAATIAISGTVMGAVWIGGGLAFLILLREIPAHGRLAAITVLLAVWAGDTFAYAGGRLLGRHKMAPATSPGKTWEGFVVGSAATIFVAFVALYHQHFLTIGQSVALGVVVAVAAPLGDLFESLLKRDMEVKDTGTLLGGHGGMLDRIDALLFAAPAAYFVILAVV
jgi:phosphatidate cytidylyltransferase